MTEIVVGRAKTRPHFQRLCDVVERHELRVFLEPTGHEEELFVWVTDGAQGKTGHTAEDASQLDEAALGVLGDLAGEGFR